MSSTEMKITALVPWFGSNRYCAAAVGEALKGCEWVGVVFAGSMTEVRHIDARTLLVNDLHPHLINLARVVSDPVEGPKLYRRLRRRIFHPDELATAQILCSAIDAASEPEPLFGAAAFSVDPLEWAEAYFVAAWMGRSGCAGTSSEFKSSLATRFNAGGGDSAVRYQNAIRGLPAWRRIMRRCTFERMDAFEFIGRALQGDAKPHTERRGIYCDPPFPGPGDSYKHTFGEAGQRRLAELCGTFKRYRVVMRFYDHPLIRELYPESQWRWTFPAGGRTQTNEAAPEVLLINRVEAA